MIRQISIVLLMFVVITLMAQDDVSYKVIEKDGKKYYEYVVQASEGVWGISRRFDVTQADIYKANPDAEKGLRPGQVIHIPIAQAVNSTVLVEKQKEGLTHVVQQGQTLYSISKIYGLKVDELLKLNSDITSDIKQGDVLLVKKHSGTERGLLQEKAEGQKYFTIKHTVEKETLYSLSKKYGVEIHDIIAINRELEKGVLKKGMHIYISNDPEVLKRGVLEESEVQAEDKLIEDTAKQVVEQAPITQIDGSPENSDTLEVTVGGEIDMSISGEDTIPAAEGAYDVALTDSGVAFAPSATSINVVVLLPFMSHAKYVEPSVKKFVEFYKGMLLSMEIMKKAGSHFVVNTYDTQKSDQVLDSLFRLETVKNADIIVGPAYPNEVPMVLNFAKNNNIPCLVPFTNKIADEFKYDNLVQFNPAYDEIADAIYRDMFRGNNVKYVFARTARCVNNGNSFANLLLDRMKTDSIPYSDLVIDHSNVDTLLSLAAMDSVMLVVANSDKNQVAPLLKKIKDLNLQKLSIFGNDNWGEETLSICANTYYYSIFDSSSDLSAYELNYLKWYGDKGPEEKRSYDVIGYDIFSLVMDIVTEPNSTLYTNDISKGLYLQTVPELKYANNKGYMNTRFYLYTFDGMEFKKVK